MRNIGAVFSKQIMDTVKNKAVFIQFVMLPVLAVIMENSIKIQDMPEHFFAKLFAVMFVGMAPLCCMSSIISEEKEANTLRALMMSGVKPWQYLTGTGAYVFIMCMAGTAVFAILGRYTGARLAVFLFAMSAGIILSGLIGAVIGIFSGNQMAATSLSIPIMMIFSFTPMLSTFNESIRKPAQIIYSQRISDIISGVGTQDISAGAVVVIAVNFAVGIALFALAYRKKGLE